MQTIIKSIRECILTRVRGDRIAPILKTISTEEDLMHDLKKWNQAILQLPESKTMHTEPSHKYDKCKLAIVEPTLSTKPTPQPQNLSSELSADTLSKVTHDLSRMLKDVYGCEDKPNDLNLKFSRRLNHYPSLSRKTLRKKFSLHNISAIRPND
jgi:hypothetical protein